MEKPSQLLRKGAALAKEQGVKHGKGAVYRGMGDTEEEKSCCALGMIALATVGKFEKLPDIHYPTLWNELGLNEQSNSCLMKEVGMIYTDDVTVGIFKLNDYTEKTPSEIADILEDCGY